jgi:hypothetical protein
MFINNRIIEMSQIYLNKDDYKFLEANNFNNDTPKFSLKGYKTYGKCVKVYDGDTIHVIFTPLHI